MKILWVVYGSLDQQSGGYLYDRRVVGFLRAHGVEVEVLGLAPLPYLLCPLHSLQAGLRAALAPQPRAGGWDAVVIDELCHPSVFLLAAARARARRRRPPSDPRPPLVTLVHHLRCQEDRPPPARTLARAWERRLLASSEAVIVNSHTTARTVRELLRCTGDAGAPRIAVCPPGCDQLAFSSTAPAAALDPRPAPERPVRLLATGNLIPRKGYDLLLEMLAGLRDLPWELQVAGRAVDAAYRRRLDRLARRLGLRERVAFLGELDGACLAEEYRAADVFVFASRYEGYGISLAEAVRAGLPFVAFAAGAVAEVVGGRGLLVPPGDRDAFAGHLRRLVAEPAFRRQAAALSCELAAGLPIWEDTGRGVLQALGEAVGERAGRG